jgi:hypothetical protein
VHKGNVPTLFSLAEARWPDELMQSPQAAKKNPASSSVPCHRPICGHLHGTQPMISCRPHKCFLNFFCHGMPHPYLFFFCQSHVSNWSHLWGILSSHDRCILFACQLKNSAACFLILITNTLTRVFVREKKK